MADARQPSFATALVAVLAGAAISAWIAALFVGAAPSTSVEAWAILTSICGAVGVKAMLRILKYDVPFAFARRAARRPLRQPHAGAADARPGRPLAGRFSFLRP